MKLTVKRVSESIIMLAISVALWQLTLIPVADAINKKIPLSFIQNIMAFIGLLVPIVLISLYAVKQNYLNWKDLRTDRSVLKWMTFGLIAAILLHFIVTCIGLIEGESYLNTAKSSEVNYLVIDIMTACILSPLAEELVFRKILTTVIFPKNLKISLIITGIVFAAIHLPVTLGDWVNQLGAAAVLSFTYYKTRKVELCILIHIIMNMFITGIYFWTMFNP